MKKYCLSLLFIIFNAIILLCFIGCNSGSKHKSSINLGGIELSVEPGERWLGKMKILIFSINKTPQMAAWIENEQGNYISTIIVTNKNVKKNWTSAPKEGRPEALPVWNNKIQNNINISQIDSVSAATSKGAVDVKINNGSLINGQEYSVYLEINHSFDYNDFWTENNSGVNGQPSLIYHANFIAGVPGRIALYPIGYGSVDGSDGNIIYGFNGITTALTIIKNVNLTVY